MKNSELRTILEAELLSFKKADKKLTDSEFDRYCDCLLTLCRLDCISALEQSRIYTATYGDLIEFVSEFFRYISPLTTRRCKKIYYPTVLHTRTNIMFSPRLTEIALSCILRYFLADTSSVEMSFFTNSSYVAITISGRSTHYTNSNLVCAAKIAHLHSGRIISEFHNNKAKINLFFPILPRINPIKLVPCSTELCRLCRI